MPAWTRPATLLGAALLVACPSSDAPEPTPGGLGFSAPERLAEWLSGEFDSSAQAAKDPTYFAIQLVACPVEAPELGERVLYIEQARVDDPGAPYRQRLYVVSGDPADESVARTEVYTLIDAAGAVGLCARSARSGFAPADATLREGCGVTTTWEAATEAFVGGTSGKSCESTLSGATYATSEVRVEAGLLTSWDRGFDAQDQQVWGATEGPYRFVRRQTAGDDDDAAGDDDDVDPDALVEEIAGAICASLDRCCDGRDAEDYFAAYTRNELLADLAPALPPATAWEAMDCPGTVAEALGRTPFGDWAEAVAAGRVALDADAYAGCLAELDGAPCGDPLRAALFDSTCFGFAAPMGGEHQRSSFVRSGTDGAPCSPIRDGFGAAHYGTCDPTQAFCCYEDAASPGSCAGPFGQDGAPREGICRPAAELGEACSFLPTQLCRTGLECDFVTNTCIQPLTGPLDPGDPCMDDGFELLGECVDSWCDMFGTRTCLPLRDVGAACTAGWECASGLCDAVCVENRMCDGE